MKNTLLTIIIAVIATTGCLGQKNQSKVYGVVLDSLGNPVRDLTVFIPFTSKGTTTNLQGEYQLENIPSGDLELVFRHVSYLPKTEFFSVEQGKSIELNVRMQNNVIEMAEIIKKANPANWKFGYEKFKEHVLGDPLGRYCELKNTDEMFFYYDGQRLTGHATEPLEIVNNYLGYRMIYFLDYFWYNDDVIKPDGKVEQASYAFSGSAFYVDRIPTGDRHSTMWEDNRLNEFKGTLQHFLLSVFDSTVIDQGFQVRQAWKNIQDIQESLKVNKAIAYSKSLEMKKRFYWDKDSKKSIFLYYSPTDEYPIDQKISDLKRVPPAKSILIDDPILVFYYFNSDHLEDEARVTYLAIRRDGSGEKPQLIIDNHGNYKVIGGKLIWQYLDTQTKLVTALPADYYNERIQKND